MYNQNAHLTVLVGPSGAGKTHFARFMRDLSPRFTKIISSDAIRRRIQLEIHEEGGHYKDDKEAHTTQVFDDYYRQITHKLNYGSHVIADAPNMEVHNLQKLYDIAEEVDIADMHVIFIDRPVSMKHRDGSWRLKRRSRHGDGWIEHQHQFFWRNLGMLAAKLQELKVPYRHRIIPEYGMDQVVQHIFGAEGLTEDSFNLELEGQRSFEGAVRC